MSSAEVSFVAGRRPEEATHIRLADFDGPLALLLALIEQRQLDVLTVRLGDLAAAYLQAMARLEGGQLPLLSSFVAVSAQLILIKSRELLPRPPALTAGEAESAIDPEEDLRQRLIVYRRYRDAGQMLVARLESGAALFRREPAATSAAALRAGGAAAAGPPLPVELLVEALTAGTRHVPPPAPPPEVLGRVITIEERAEAIREALRSVPAIVLQDLLRDVSDRVVVAVTFMALLELVKAKELRVEQREPWGPIEIARREADA
jgi:segregation and condensation protein A